MTAPAADRPAGPPARAGDTTRENPWPVRALAQRMVEYIGRAPAAWVEGQIAQLNLRPGASTAFLTLRDPAVEMSLQLTCHRSVIAALPTPPTDGERVVVHGKFDYWPARGSLSFRVDAMHPVGLGELLARLERLRQLLAAEGLSAAARKRPLPFLPRRIGLITGRDSAAEKDVVVNARHRWPAARFTVEHTVVQGNQAVPQILEALLRLENDPQVEVIVIARGGGSVEDLLPFSDEALCRAVAGCRTPVVSAIGHEPDHPILDDVADLRCSTPTDAGKKIVPDAAAEHDRVEQLRHRARRALVGWVSTERARLDRLTSAAVLADPYGPIRAREDDVGRLVERSRRVIGQTLERVDRDLAHRRAQLAVLGPAATLARGYAVVQAGGRTGAVVHSVKDVPAGTSLRIRVADGAFAATSTGPELEDPA
ncbi:exodeoxyribonuclease VII large subunit [Nakamurella lactea]|uniref:exodeoxyribonuclease VII large subunit n=1 Tax=Nakamurella lactea TaxID=459515 RepID=UPI00041AFBCA|nr:exodeoxyribonuclease VII large subunit [Nakamurella lactea]